MDAGKKTQTALWMTATLITAAALLVPSFPSAEAATTRVVTITTTSAQPRVAFKTFDGNPAKVFDINNDGKMEIVAQNDNQYVYVFDSKTGKLLFEATTTFPPSWGARSFNGPEVAIMQAGGSVRLIVANSAAYITSFKFTGSGSTFSFVKEWEKRVTTCHSNPGMDAKPVLADLDKDGRLEILVATEERGLFALRSDGAAYWHNCLGGGNAEPGVADLNLDGWPDVVHVSDAGIVSALNGRTGGWMWAFDARVKYGLSSGSIPVGPGIGQLDGLGGPDIVVGARDSHDSTNWDNDHALLLALDSGGRVLWAKQDTHANPLTYTHPVVVDADKNGLNEVYWGDWNTVGHKPPPPDSPDAWKTTGPANFYRYDNFGNLVWRTELGTWWSNKDLALADVDADGVQEVLANGPNGAEDGIWYLNGNTGAKESFVSTHPYKVARGPIVADLWRTGTMQWVVEASAAILVFDTGVAYSSAWPHLPYESFPHSGTPSPTTTTTSTLPTSVTPVPTTPPPLTTTTTPAPTATTTPAPGGATFTLSPNVNEWWVEVRVDWSKTVTGVDARVNGGSWIPLEKKSWGNWAKSFFVARGSSVDFQATASDGTTSFSPTFTWLSGSGFTATFQPCCTDNNWWVEVKVTSTHTIAAVDVSVNNGAWQPLSKTSWGTWAKSFFVADGSKVVFRATDENGATALSSTYTWT
ncbi:MAG: VCBS repeat-containing protein [Euryarchaeota archaeon]|nr:VCBS repeat-containing protein [Euryarchaeota archaeon]